MSRGGTLTIGEERLTVPALPCVSSEIESIGQWLKRKDILVVSFAEDEANRECVLEAWTRAAFVHVACHGIFRRDRPAESGLVLVPNGVGEVLVLRDLGRCDLSRTRHVTLSSCWGADNFVLPGRWIITLPKTLCRQGVGSVLACLWEVDDEEALADGRHFYELLKELPRDVALQRAQKKIKENTRTNHPFFWAGYRLHSNAGHLN